LDIWLQEWALREGRMGALLEDTTGSFIEQRQIHCIIFPTMLKEGSYILQTMCLQNEFLNLEGNKLSTSKNWAVWLHEYLVDFPGQQDVLRFCIDVEN
jgi:methionyl-tRNA synthetase